MVKRRVAEKESFYAFWVNLQRMKTKGCKKGRQRLTQGQTHTHTHTHPHTHTRSEAQSRCLKSYAQTHRHTQKGALRRWLTVYQRKCGIEEVCVCEFVGESVCECV